MKSTGAAVSSGIFALTFIVGAIYLHEHQWLLHTKTCGSLATHNPLLCWCTYTCQHLIAKWNIVDIGLWVVGIVFAVLCVANIFILMKRRQIPRSANGPDRDDHWFY